MWLTILYCGYSLEIAQLYKHMWAHYILLKTQTSISNRIKGLHVLKRCLFPPLLVASNRGLDVAIIRLSDFKVVSKDFFEPQHSRGCLVIFSFVKSDMTRRIFFCEGCVSIGLSFSCGTLLPSNVNCQCPLCVAALKCGDEYYFMARFHLFSYDIEHTHIISLCSSEAISGVCMY